MKDFHLCIFTFSQHVLIYEISKFIFFFGNNLTENISSLNPHSIVNA
jgi:hypothetical protein